MSIDFGADRWQTVQDDCRRWWAGELDRPLVTAELGGRDPGRPMPAAPLLSQATCTDLSVPADALVDRIDWELSCRSYLGDAFPWVNMDCFGPGVMAAFLGADIDNSTGNVWFHPRNVIPLRDLHLEYDPDNVWLRRVKELYAAMMRRWEGQVLVGMTDLGGNLDVLSTFRPADALLLDLYDAPEHVTRLLGEIHELWHRFFSEINRELCAVNPGYTAWCGIYSDLPYYMLQCDFSYMIGPPMFKRFARAELDATTRRLARSFYHLDGKGELPHLDSLLSLEHLDGVQWIPGAGMPDCPLWPEVYERILSAGKKAQVPYGSPAETYAMLQRTGVGAGVHYRAGWYDRGQEVEIRRWLDRFQSGGFGAAKQ